MKKLKYVLSFILFFVLISIIQIPITYNKYKSTYNRQITLNVTSPEYTVSYYNKVPKEYQEVEYIQSSGTQYINTGVPLSATTKLEADFQYTSLTGKNGLVVGDDSFYYGINNGKFVSKISSDSNSSDTIITNTNTNRHTIALESGKTTFDGTEYTSGTLNPLSDIYIYIQ